MSEEILERLSRFTPNAGELDRDALLFAAGRNSVRPNRGWKAVTSLLTVTQALSLALLWPSPNLTTGPSATSVAGVPRSRQAPDHVGTEADPLPPSVSSVRLCTRGSDLESRPTDVTFIEQEPPLRAIAPLPASLLN